MSGTGDEHGDLSTLDRNAVVDFPGYFLSAAVERYDDAADRCTMFPPDDDQVDIAATWITGIGEGKGFVDLEDWQ